MTQKWHKNDTEMTPKWRRNGKPPTDHELKNPAIFQSNDAEKTQKWHKNDTKMTSFNFHAHHDGIWDGIFWPKRTLSTSSTDCSWKMDTLR